MMNILSPYIVAIVAGFFLSQFIKAVIAVIQQKHRGIRANLFISGGMPSSHSATAIALWVTVLLLDGVGSAVFGLASAFALIVLYDAVKVRRSSGEQGVALIAIITQLEESGAIAKGSVPLPRVAMGHTPKEVLAGAVLGVAIGISIAALYSGVWSGF